MLKDTDSFDSQTTEQVRPWCMTEGNGRFVAVMENVRHTFWLKIDCLWADSSSLLMKSLLLDVETVTVCELVTAFI